MRAERPRRVVLLVDVSGSMAPYADALLRFAHAATRGSARTEVFTVGTRLTRVTRELSHRDPDLAMTALAEAVPDWRGGTRLGELLREFLNRWGQRGMARGAVVVVLSDGWERGDPDLLAAQMHRLHRLAHRVVWANPLKARPGYAPLASGMAAALPDVDAFVEGHSLAALEELARVVRGAATPGGRVHAGAGGRTGHPGGRTGHPPRMPDTARRTPDTAHRAAATPGRPRGASGKEQVLREILPALSRWYAAGAPFGLATVVGVSRSAPRDPGATMAVGPKDEVVGSVSGGCVEGAVFELAQEVVTSGEARLTTFGYSDEDAFAVGLTCGGEITVLVRPVTRDTPRLHGGRRVGGRRPSGDRGHGDRRPGPARRHARRLAGQGLRRPRQRRSRRRRHRRRPRRTGSRRHGSEALRRAW